MTVMNGLHNFLLQQHEQSQSLHVQSLQKALQIAPHKAMQSYLHMTYRQAPRHCSIGIDY